jgi:four helix bundle protein
MTIYQTKLRILEQRMTDFSVEVIQSFDKYSRSPTLQSSVQQLLKSATSIGANYAEANNSSSKTDFKNKIFIAKKEAAETRYWLNILARVIPDGDFSVLQQEALELNLILQKIISTMKNARQSG